MNTNRHVMLRLMFRFCVAAGGLAMAATTWADEVLFVSPAGNDGWSGTQPQVNAAGSDGPLATLDRARQVVRARISKGLTAPITVNILGGEYALDATVAFGPEDMAPIPFEVRMRQ